ISRSRSFWLGKGVSGLHPEHRRVPCLQDLSVTQVHMHTTGQARIETAYRAYDIDTLEFIGNVFLEDRRVLHRILVRTRRPVNVARVGVPGSRRIRMVIGDLAFANYHV